MDKNRIARVNSLLREVLADVIRKEVKNPHMSPLVTVTHVEVSKDLQQAKVYVSIIGNEAIRKATLEALQSAAGFIAICASKQVVLRYFPNLYFYLDQSAERHSRIEEVLQQIQKEKDTRE